MPPRKHSQGPKNSRTGALLARRQLHMVSEALRTFPLTSTDPTKAAETYSDCSRSRDFKRLGFVALEDGVAILYTTDNWLENRSHRFVFSDEGHVRYHREAFNIDPQKLPSPTLNLESADAIARHDQAAAEVSFIKPQIIRAAKTSWQDLGADPIRVAAC